MLSEDVWVGFHYQPDDALISFLATVDVERDKYRAHLTETESMARHFSLRSYATDFLARFTAHSAAIEGSTLTVADTRAVIDGEFIPRNAKEVTDMLSAKGIAEGYQWGIEQVDSGRVIDADFIRDLHLRTALDIHADARGVFRASGVIVTGAAFTPPPAQEVYQDIPYICDCYYESSQHPLVAAAVFHIMFERIHPFYDGNGRTGRTLLNLMLHNTGYAPIAVKNSGAREYIAALADWDATRTPAAFVSLVAEEVRGEMRQQQALIQPSQHSLAQVRSNDVTPEQMPDNETRQSQKVRQSLQQVKRHVRR